MPTALLQDEPTATTRTDITHRHAGQNERGQAALRDLLRPVATTITLAKMLAALSAVLAVAPYIALVHLGEILLTAHSHGARPDREQVTTVVLVLAGTFTARLGLHFLALTVMHLADLRLRHHLRSRILNCLGTMPLSHFTSTASGRIRKAVQDDTLALHNLVAHAPVETTAAIVTPAALLIYAFVVDWRLGLTSIATFPAYLILMAVQTKDMGAKTAEMERRLADVSARMIEFVSGLLVVKTFGHTRRAHEQYTTAAEDFHDFYLAWCGPLMRAGAIGTSTVAPGLLLLINLGVGSLLIHAGQVGVADVLATTLIALVLPASIETLAVGQWNHQRAGAAALRIIEATQEPTLPEPGQPVTLQGHRVEIDHVSYSYGRTLAVDDVTLTLEPGTVTALIGPSGSGKSTLATLVARFADPDEGTIRLGGVDLREIGSTQLYRQVAFVLQDPQLLRLTVRENIALARPEATDEQVRAAAVAACIHEEITALPDGYDTVLGGYTDLSGGQRQRIAIARALLADAPVLILDEATALTDPESTTRIQQALDALVVGRTVLVIAHRPHSIVGADRIVVLDRGRIIAEGNHTDLDGQEHYAALWGKKPASTSGDPA
ncbi:ATP-binding cassette, subfamily B [Austwickia chelonae]|uniref:Putative ABC transporter permease/ATP-binding protein n=2 Tax=Austwickia TaxID=1184606 RepID=K6VK02_9MICO|nr:putative ABC transporter permease/ATP-binding protein [Austwickia chelonae NBRC 105200]SEW33357.1 ATP-binding cassette, subfamily B [Austwickia chelonae]